MEEKKTSLYEWSHNVKKIKAKNTEIFAVVALSCILAVVSRLYVVLPNNKEQELDENLEVNSCKSVVRDHRVN
jgi:hypothetical protein